LNPVLLAGTKVCELKTVTHQITQLANWERRHKASGDEIVFEQVFNPFGILFIGFLAANSLNIFWMSQCDFAGSFIHRNPILAGGFHTNLCAGISAKPL